MKRRMIAFIGIATALGFGVAGATSDAVDRVLGEDEIITLTSGKTFHYTLNGRPRGAEQHYTDGRVTWRLPDGLCMHGVWVAKEETLCYYYGSLRYGCWNVIESDGVYRHAPLTWDGKPDSGPSVYVKRISEEPVGCTPQQLAFLR